MARSPHPGRHHVRIFALDRDDEVHEADVTPPNPAVTDGTFSLLYPDEVPSGRPLRAAAPYGFTISHEQSGELLGEGRFVTAPQPGSAEAARTVIGIMSCHNPFAADGTLRAKALRCLDVAPCVFEQSGASRLLLMGDQVYGDLPEELSLFEPEFFRQVAPPGRGSIFECTREEVRSLYQERHRIFYKTDRIRELQSRWACHPILDDHEVVDNFGSLPEHATERWANIREGALDAFHDYQARRVFGERRPPSFHHGFELGDVAVFVMDLRSQRKAEDGRLQMFGPSQLAALRRFLAAHRRARALVLLLSVPILHLPDWMVAASAHTAGEGSDAGDRWSYPPAQRSRGQLLDLLESHSVEAPRQRMVLVGGDIHVGAAMRLRWRSGSHRCYQLVSSAVSNLQGRMHELLVDRAPMPRRARRQSRRLYWEAELLDGIEGADHNPFAGLNVGTVEIETRGQQTAVRLRLHGADGREVPEPVVVFDSGDL